MKFSRTESLLDGQQLAPRTRIVLMGVGGAGCNSVARMASAWSEGPETVVLNTDIQALTASGVKRQIQLGPQIAKGLGAGGDVSIGKLAAEESIDQIQSMLDNKDFLMLVVGLGGGTGTGAAPVILEAAKQLGVLTICFATLPFAFEGARRMRQAEEGLKILRRTADAVICLPNDRLAELAGIQSEINGAFEKSDELVGNAVHSLWRLLTLPGVINLDFADVRELAEHSGGLCAFSYVEASGSGRAAMALSRLMESLFLDKGRLLSGAAGVLVNVIGGPDLTLADVQGVMGQLSSFVRPTAHIFFGALIDPTYKDKIALTVLTSENWLEERAAKEGGKKAVSSRDTLFDHALVDVAAKPEGQQKLNLEPYDKGRFKNVEPTFYDGEDLDIPTYLRRGIKLSFDK